MRKKPEDRLMRKAREKDSKDMSTWLEESTGKGKEKANIEIAKKLIKSEFPVDTIEGLTGLNKCEIEELRSKMII